MQQESPVFQIPETSHQHLGTYTCNLSQKVGNLVKG